MPPDRRAEPAREHDPDSVLTPDVDPTATATPAEPGASVPDLSKTAQAISTPRGRGVELTIIATLAVLYTAFLARGFVIPVAFALLLNFLLSPAIRGLSRFKVAPPLGAAIVVLALLGMIGGGGYALAGPAQRWATTAPASLQKAESRLKELFRPVAQVQRTAEQVQKATSSVGGSGDGPAKTVVVQEGRTFADRIFGTTEKLLVGTLEVMILLYFLLAGGDLFLQKLIKVLPHFEDKRKAVEIARASEAAVSAYLSTALLVNVLEGLVVGIILWIMDVPGAIVLGVMVAFLEFIPYLGAAVATIVLGIVGLTTFDTIGKALLVPGSFLIVNIIQANIVTPMLQGHRLTLNPVAIFVGLTFFYFIWGIPGAFLAVPLLATFKILCDHVDSMAAIGEFLGERDEKERRRVVRDDDQAPVAGA